MKKIIEKGFGLKYVFLILFFVQLANGQSFETYSAKQLNEKAMDIHRTEPEKAMQLVKSAEKKALQLENKKELSVTYSNYAVLFRLKGEFKEAIKYAEKALKLSNDSLLIASCNNTIGACKRSLGFYEEGLKNYLIALKIYESKKDIDQQGTVINNIGMIYSQMDLLEKAKVYHRKAIAIFQKSKYQKGLSESYNNLAIALANQDSLTKALRYFNYSLQIEEKLKDKKGIAESYNNVAGIYYYLQQIDSAKYYFEKSVELEREIKNFPGVAASYNNLALVMLEFKRNASAKNYIDSAFYYAKKSKVAEDYVNALENYALYYEALSDYKTANDYNKKFFTAKDSVFKNSNLENLHELEVKYKSAQKDAEISKNKAEIAENELQIKQKNTIIYGSVGFAILLGLVGYLFYNQQKIKNIQLLKEVELKEALVKIETQNKLQEQRLQISRDLHDNIGSQLTFIISSIDNLKYFDIAKEKLVSKFDNISGFTKNTITELRDTIWAMNKNAISVEDLQIRITNFIDNAQLATHGISFDFSIADSINSSHEFSSIEGRNIYRIIQEAVNNAIKYANATEIKIVLKQENNKMIFLIKDNGIGFSEAEIELGNGLYNMKKRALELNADFKIISEKGNGTTILIEKEIS